MLAADRAGGLLRLPGGVALVIRERLIAELHSTAARDRRRRPPADPSAAPSWRSELSRSSPCGSLARGLHAGRDLLLLIDELIRLVEGIFGRRAGAGILVLLQQPLRVLKLLGARDALRASVGVARRGLPHRIRGILQPPRRISEVLTRLPLPLGVTLQLLELARRLFHFVGERTLTRSAAATARLRDWAPRACCCFSCSS